MSTQQDKIIVGSEEWCYLPQLGIPAVKARVDSGARTSSLHAFNIRPFTRGGQRWVSFEVHPLQKNRRTIIRCEAQVIDRRVVKSSSGIGEKRYVVSTELQLNGQSWPVELTLSNRDSMGYRMLLGRQACAAQQMTAPAVWLTEDPQTSKFLPGIAEGIHQFSVVSDHKVVESLIMRMLDIE